MGSLEQRTEYERQNDQVQKVDFRQQHNNKDESEYLGREREAARGKYEVKAGWLIPAVLEQIREGRARGLPWGVSESAYAKRDESLAYQYGPQGTAALALQGLAGLAAESVPRAEAIRLDRGVLAFALLLGVATPLLAALLGALRLRGEVGDAMRSGGKGGAMMMAGRTRLLPVLGVALSTLGLFAAAALVASLVRVQNIDPGYRVQNV